MYVGVYFFEQCGLKFEKKTKKIRSKNG